MKHFISLSDFTSTEVKDLILNAAKIKKELKSGLIDNTLSRKSIALIFEKPSLRTHVTFETGIFQMGGNSTYLSSGSIGLGKRESVKDVAKGLSRWVDAVVIRTFAHSTAVELAEHSSIPVINALTDGYHPCQALATGLTLLEHFDRLENINVVFVGDANNVSASLLLLCSKLGLKGTLISPEGCDFGSDVKALFAKDNGNISTVHTLEEGLKDADFIYSDVFTSMGEEDQAAEKNKRFAPYQINGNVMKMAKPGALFSHCLPAHRGEEVTDEVMDAPYCVAFDEAENRLHAQKAVLKELFK